MHLQIPIERMSWRVVNVADQRNLVMVMAYHSYFGRKLYACVVVESSVSLEMIGRIVLIQECDLHPYGN